MTLRSAIWFVLSGIFMLFVTVWIPDEAKAAGKDQTAVVNEPPPNVQGHTAESTFHNLSS